MNWMNVVELNIFVLIAWFSTCVMLAIIICSFANQLDKHKREIKELRKEVVELKDHIKE